MSRAEERVSGLTDDRSGREGHHGDDGTAGSQRGSLRDPKAATTRPEAVPGVGTTHRGDRRAEEHRGKIDSGGVVTGDVGLTHT